MTLRKRLLVIPMLCLLAGLPTAQARRPAKSEPVQQDESGLRQLPTRSYVIHTDISDDQLEIVIPHLERMADEYSRRLSSLPGQTDDRRLPLYLFSDRQGYQKAGGRPDSAGFYDGERLLALTGEKADARAWHIIQHEAFHQYLTNRLGTEIPMWINEGMAEYFGESLYTGDGFVSGVLPPWRVERIQQKLNNGGYLPLAELLSMSPDQWNKALNGDNYDQAWSLVQFLAHGDNGRHQADLLNYLKESSHGVDSLKSFAKCVGNVREVEAAWAEYYAGRSKIECARGYGLAAVQTYCAFLARATVARQKIMSIDQLCQMALAGTLRQPKGDMLPTYLLSDYKEWSGQLGHYDIDLSPKSKAHVTLRMPDDTKIFGRFTLRGGKVFGVEAWTDVKVDRKHNNAK